MANRSNIKVGENYLASWRYDSTPPFIALIFQSEDKVVETDEEGTSLLYRTTAGQVLARLTQKGITIQRVEEFAGTALADSESVGEAFSRSGDDEHLEESGEMPLASSAGVSA